MSGSGISWAMYKSAPHSRQVTMPAPHHSVFYRPDALPAAKPIVSKHWRHNATRPKSASDLFWCLLIDSWRFAGDSSRQQFSRRTRTVATSYRAQRHGRILCPPENDLCSATSLRGRVYVDEVVNGRRYVAVVSLTLLFYPFCRLPPIFLPIMIIDLVGYSLVMIHFDNSHTHTSV